MGIATMPLVDPDPRPDLKPDLKPDPKPEPKTEIVLWTDFSTTLSVYDQNDESLGYPAVILIDTFRDFAASPFVYIN